MPAVSLPAAQDTQPRHAPASLEEYPLPAPVCPCRLSLIGRCGRGPRSFQHQDDALAALQRLREEGKTIALLDHATGAGKTVTAIADAQRLGARTLWLVHRRDLVAQTHRAFQKLWPEAATGRYFGGAHETDADNLVAAIQSVADHLDEFAPGEFQYLVIDEAHHAAADTYRRVLEYFRPRFILGQSVSGRMSNREREQHLWTKDYQEINIFNWQEVVANMISLPDLERELGVAEGRVRGAVERGQVQPDHILELGERTYLYFHRDRIEDVRVAIGAPKRDDHSLRDRFLEFISAMDMTLSYKPVMLLALLENIDEQGRAKLSQVVQRFQQFYRDRRAAGLLVERPGARKLMVDELDATSAQRLMLGKPFETFERRQFLRYDRDLAYVRFDPRLWRQLEPEDLDELRQTCQQSITAYYERMGKP